MWLGPRCHTLRCLHSRSLPPAYCRWVLRYWCQVQSNHRLGFDSKQVRRHLPALWTVLSCSCRGLLLLLVVRCLLPPPLLLLLLPLCQVQQALRGASLAPAESC